jgi:polar amino acid transport system substrate-binding protein
MESKTTSGKPVGFDIDMANAIGKLWKVKATFVGTAFTGLLPGLAAKKCHVVISGIFVTPDRTAKFPAVPYMRTHRALVVEAGNPKHIKSPDDLSGKSVAVQQGTKYEVYLKDLNDQFKSSGKPQMNLSSYPGDTDAIAQLLIGRADAVLTQDTEGAYQKRQHPGKLAIAYLFPETDTFGIYYRKSDNALGAAFKSAIKTLKKNGTLKKLAAKQQIPAADVK